MSEEEMLASAQSMLLHSELGLDEAEAPGQRIIDHTTESIAAPSQPLAHPAGHGPRYVRFWVQMPVGTVGAAGERAFDVQVSERFSPKPLSMEPTRRVTATAEATTEGYGGAPAETTWAIMLDRLRPKTAYVLRVRAAVDGVVGDFSPKSKPFKTLA
jgi:hypothetical protein